MPQHLLKLSNLSSAQAAHIVARATALKKLDDPSYKPFSGKSLAMIFAKSSTRTRVSFEAGMARFGGHALYLSTSATQMGRDEPIADTARVLSRMVDVIMMRNDAQSDIDEMAAHSRVPVINGLSELHHPCQLLADMQTWQEHAGDIKGKSAAWIGDGNNVCHSWIEAATLFDFHLKIACPPGFSPHQNLVADAGSAVTLYDDPEEACRDADVVITDTWTSMGQEAERLRRLQVFANHQVNDHLMSLAKPDAIFMHCLPAHRGEEVSASVIDGRQSVVWDEAENRLWAQMALLEFLLEIKS